MKQNKFIRMGLSALLGLTLFSGLIATFSPISPRLAQAHEQSPDIPREYLIQAAPVYSTETTVSLDDAPSGLRQAQQGFATVAHNSTDNQFMLTWTDFRNDNGSSADEWENPDIYGHRLNGSGALIGANNTDILAASSSSDIQNNSKLIYNPDRNEYLAVWRNHNGSFSNPNVQIYTSLVAADGTAGSGNVISSGDDDHKFNPAAVYGAACNSGEYFIVWPIDIASNRAENYDIKAQRVSGATGMSTGLELDISTAASSQLFPDIAYNSSTLEYFVVWQSSENGTLDIYGQRFNCNGVAQGSVVTVANDATPQIHPTIAYNSSRDEYLVVWEDYRNGTSDVYGQRIQADGSMEGANFAITTVSKNQNFPKVAYDSQKIVNGTDRYLVVWEDLRNGSSYQIYGQLVRGDGTFNGVGGDFAVASVTRNQRNPNLAYNSNDDTFLITWSDESTPGEASLDTDIFSRLMTFIPEEPFLTISKSAPLAVLPGDPITYTLTVANVGTVAASNLVITDSIPNGATYISGGNKMGNVISWTVGALGANNASIESSYVVTASGTITNSDYHVSSNAGEYTASGTKAVVTLIEPPTADFTATPLAGSIPLTVTFTNLHANPLHSHLWDFGDGQSSTALNPSHTYLTAGTYSVTLTVSDNDTSDTLTKTPYIVATAQFAELIQVGENWRYFKGTQAPPSNWQAIGFNDSGWAIGPSGFGYDDDDDATILNDMPNPPNDPGYLTVFIRKSFDIITKTGVTSLTLEIDYDDGFVAYLNGTAVATQNVTNPAYDEGATAGREAGTADIIDLTAHLNVLQSGENVLAVQGHNQTIDSSDFSLIPALKAKLSTVIPPPPAPDLSITKSGPLTATAGAAITYTLTVTNSGAISASNLIISDTIPTGATYVSGGTKVGQVVSWNVATLAAHSSISYSFVVTATATVSITNDDYTVVAGGGYDADGDTAIVTQIISPPSPILTITKNGPLTTTAGAAVTYTLTVVNIGTIAASNVVITDAIPNGATYLSGGTKVGNVISWTINTLEANNGTVETTFVVTTTTTITNSDYRVSSDDGAYKASGTQVVVTRIERPTAIFTGTPLLGSIPLTVTFSNPYANPLYSYLWDFGDDQSSTDPNPSHTYLAAGIYSVTLLATDGHTSDILTKTAYITATNQFAELIQVGDEWSYRKGNIPPPFSWYDVNLDDSSWVSGPSGLGYETEAVNSYPKNNLNTIFTDMKDSYVSLFIRNSFEVITSSGVITMALAISYDDAFIAYLNSTPVLTVNIDDADYNETAISSHEADDPEIFDLSVYLHLLNSGKNVLAIQGHNGTLDSSDFVLIPTLLANLSNITPPPPTPNLLITKNGPPLAMLGNTVSYDLIISNNGTGAATNLVITDTLPTNVSYVSGGILTGNEVSWSEASLPIDGQVTKTLTVQPLTSLITNSQYTVRADNNISAMGVNPVTTQIVNEPTASFMATPLNGSIPLTVTFINQSVGGTQYLWDFGDGNSNTEINPTHVYYKTGNYTVSLQVSDGVNSNTMTRPFFISVDKLSTDPIKIGDLWRYFKGTQAPPSNWNRLGFDDTVWDIGPSGFGYGDGDDATKLSDMMQDLPDDQGYLTVFIRKPFTVPNTTGIDVFDLVIDYDDGFAAYLNGIKLLSKNADNTAYDDPATGEHEASNPKTFDLLPHANRLQLGQNILAIQGHNIVINSSDFSLLPALHIEFNDVTPFMPNSDNNIYLPIIIKQSQ